MKGAHFRASSSPTTEPTERQLELLRTIDTAIKRDGFAPTVRELCNAFGWTSTNAAASHLRSLKAKGLLEWRDGNSRTLKLTPAGLAKAGAR